MPGTVKVVDKGEVECTSSSFLKGDQPLFHLDSQNISFSDALQTSSTFLSSSNVLLSSISIPVGAQLPAISPETTYLQNEIHRLCTRIPQLKAQLEHLWADSKQVEYELTSVFIHRGSSPSFGHYFFYSRNLPEKPDVWFKYNDEEVTEVGKEEVFRDTTGETANPYLVCSTNHEI